MNATNRKKLQSHPSRQMELTVAEIAAEVGGEAVGKTGHLISGANALEEAAASQIAFADNPKALGKLEATSAGCVLVPKDTAPPAGVTIIRVQNPRLAFAKIAARLVPPDRPAPGIDPRATIGDGLRHGDDVSISAGVVIGDGVILGSRVCLYPNVVLGNQVVVGDDVVIYPNVTILDSCRIGNRVTIHAGTVIGSDGFGFTAQDDKYFKIPQLGIVQIDDDVEIGANNTIDRATFGKTWIQSGVKTDNLVHVAHNVTVGANTLLVAQVGIAGSSTVGRNVILAGQVGVSGHITIGDEVVVGPQSGVAQSVEPGKVVSGSAAIDHRIWLRVQQIIPRLPEIAKRLRRLEKLVAQIAGVKDNDKSRPQ